MAKDNTCLDACFGLYADVTYFNSTEMIDQEDAKEFSDLQKEYNEYKKKFLENIIFDSSKERYGKESWQNKTQEIFSLADQKWGVDPFCQPDRRFPVFLTTSPGKAVKNPVYNRGEPPSP